MSNLNPIQNAAAWSYITLGGLRSPGTIPANGVRGFDRETGWDKKKGKGTLGATLTLTTLPPAEGSFLFQLATTQDVDDWYNWVAQVLSISPAKQQAKGIDVFYAGFWSIRRVVVHKYSDAPMHVGRGMYHVEVSLIEWQPPPKTSIVSTVSSVKPDLPDNSDLDPPDPEENQRQATISMLLPQAFPGRPYP